MLGVQTATLGVETAANRRDHARRPDRHARRRDRRGWRDQTIKNLASQSVSAFVVGRKKSPAVLHVLPRRRDRQRALVAALRASKVAPQHIARCVHAAAYPEGDQWHRSLMTALPLRA